MGRGALLKALNIYVWNWGILMYCPYLMDVPFQKWLFLIQRSGKFRGVEYKNRTIIECIISLWTPWEWGWGYSRYGLWQLRSGLADMLICLVYLSLNMLINVMLMKKTTCSLHSRQFRDFILFSWSMDIAIVRKI